MPKRLQMLAAITILIAGWFLALYMWIIVSDQAWGVFLKLLSVMVLLAGWVWILRILAKEE